MTVRILAVNGSLGAGSKNLALLRRAVERAPAGANVELADSIGGLPAFDPDVDADAIPAVVRWREALRGCDAVLIACPEYGHSLPGSLKNAIDWVIGSGELYGKPVAFTAATASAARGQRGLDALAVVLGAVDARRIGGTPTVLGPSFDDELDALLRALVAAAPAPPAP